MPKIDKNRDKRYDVMKGILIYCVVLGHSLNIEFCQDSWSNNLFSFIYSFHMPLFVFISGFFLKSSLNKGFLKVIVEKCKRLMIPTILYTGLIALVFISSRSYSLFGINLGRIISLAETYWYTICIFILSIIYWILVCIRKSRFFILLFFLALLVMESFHPRIAAADCQVVRLFCVFGLGLSVAKNKINLNSSKLRLVVIPIGAILILLNRTLMGQDLTSYPLFVRIIDGLFSCCLSYCILFYFSKLLLKSHYSILCEYLGRKSLAIYLLHMLFYCYLSNNLYFRNYSTIEGVFISILLVVFCIMIISCLEIIVSQKYKYILGL